MNRRSVVLAPSVDETHSQRQYGYTSATQFAPEWNKRFGPNAGYARERRIHEPCVRPREHRQAGLPAVLQSHLWTCGYEQFRSAHAAGSWIGGRDPPSPKADVSPA